MVALYTRQNSIYNKLNLECWGIKEDARKWPGGEPVITHPPCRAWGQLRHLAKPRHDEKLLAIHALIMVRLYGGVLEHPRNSQLWVDMKLPMPGQKDIYGGWTLCINQKDFGHRAQKKTFLYIVGTTPQNIPAYELVLTKANKTVEDMGRPERERTPIKLAIWIIKLIIIIKSNGQRLLTM